MKRILHRSIATRLSVYVILMIMTLFTLSVFIIYNHAKKATITEAINSTHLELKNVANQIGSKLSMVEVAINNTAWMLEDNLHRQDSLSIILKSLVENNPIIIGSSIAFEPYYFPKKGKHFMLDSYRDGAEIICFEVDGKEKINYCGMNWYIIPKILKKTYWNDPHFDEGSTEIAISTYSYPLYNDKREVYAVFLAKISLPQFTEWVKGLSPYDSSYSFLVNQHGYYLTHPKSDKIINESIFSTALDTKDSLYFKIGKEMTAAKTGTIFYDDLYAFYTPVPNVGWSICNICPKHIITAKVDQLFNAILIYFIVGSLLIFIILYVVIRRQLSPLKYFAKSAQEIAVGDFNVQLPQITSKDEMLVLHNSFEYMQTSLKNHIIALKETIAANQRIESKLEIARQIEDSERNLKLTIEAGNIDAWSYDVKAKIFYPLGESKSFKKGPLTLDYENTIIHPDDIKIRDGIINDIIQGKINRAQTILRYKTSPSQDKYRYYETHMISKKKNDIVVAIPFAQKDITESYLHEAEKEYSQKKTDFAVSSAELALWEYNSISHTFSTYNGAVIGLDSAENLSVDVFCTSLNADESSNVELRKMVASMSESIDKSYSIDIKINPKPTDVYESMYCTIEASPFEKDEDGRVIKYVGFIKDHTKWSILNNTLVDLNIQLKMVLDVGQIYPFICDIRGDKFYFRSTVDEEPIFFIDMDIELTWEEIQIVIQPEYREKMKDLIMSLVTGDVTTICDEMRFCTDPIRDQIYEINMSLVCDQNFKGQITIIGYLQDITERRKMIFELKKAKKEAEQSAKVKAAFLANMSHEIRTPLNAIIGFSELLAEEEEEESKAEFISIISTNNNLLLKLINDVLDLSKMDAGFVDIDVSIFDFSQFFNEMYLTMQQRMTSSNVNLSITNPYSKCIVELDKNRLSQICINYITNAIKYTPKGSITMGYECINNGIRLYVKDTGIGVDDHNKHKLFQRFEKFDDFAQGTGLGLSITKTLVNSMKGEVGFESEIGSGSTFWAWIPCNGVLTEDATNNE